ncbi:hypothetical protein AC1031_016523 [Aphanomyces cochlioides]|nr:hypothetical protein AC1031_016523 [Aphanomyces cochlioides]
MASKKSKHSDYSRPVLPRVDHIRRGIPVANRVFVRNAKSRQLLLQFCGHSASHTLTAPINIPASHHLQLLQLLYIHCRPLLEFVRELIALADESCLCPDLWRGVVSDLARQSPVPAGIIRCPEEMGPIPTGIANSRVISTHASRALARNMPVLADALRISTMDINSSYELWPALAPVLLEMARFCSYLDDLPLEERDNIGTHGMEYIADELLDEWFPSAPYRRHLAPYNEVHEDDDVICTKHSPGSKLKMPGTFLFCCPHGICLGFADMHDYESPKHPFSILYRRLSDSRRKRIIIMDNACNLQTYCMRREPWFFRNVWFVVDRFHFCNHVNCSSGYCIDNFPELEHVATTVCEVFNAQFKSVVAQAGFMTKEHFISYAKHYKAYVNDLRSTTISRQMVTNGKQSFKWKQINILLLALRFENE